VFGIFLLGGKEFDVGWYSYVRRGVAPVAYPSRCDGLAPGESVTPRNASGPPRGFVRPGADSLVKLPSEVWVSQREDAAQPPSLFRLKGRFVFRCARAAAQFTDRVAVQFEAVCGVHQAIQDAVGHGGIADLGVPLGDG
jgi:hypothetical protein